MKKRFKLLLLLPTSLITTLNISPAFCQLSDVVQNLNVATGIFSYWPVDNVLTSASVAQPVSLHGTAQINFVSTHTIKLEPGFSAHGFTGSGRFHAFYASTVNAEPLSPPSVSYCPGSTQPFTLSVANPQAGVTYNWYKNNAQISNVSGSSYTENSPPLTAATYQVQAYNGSSRIFSVNLATTLPAPINNTYVPLGPPCLNAVSEGSLQNISVGGAGTYQYMIDGGSPQSSPTFNGLSTGTHTIVITDNGGCAIQQTIIIPLVNLGPQ